MPLGSTESLCSFFSNTPSRPWERSHLLLGPSESLRHAQSSHRRQGWEAVVPVTWPWAFWGLCVSVFIKQATRIIPILQMCWAQQPRLRLGMILLVAWKLSVNRGQSYVGLDHTWVVDFCNSRCFPDMLPSYLPILCHPTLPIRLKTRPCMWLEVCSL